MCGRVVLAVGLFVGVSPGVASDPGLTVLEDAVRSAPTDLQAGNRYRTAIRQAEDPDRAIRFLTALLDSDGDSSALRINLALAYVDKLCSPETSNVKRGMLSNRSIGQLDAALAIDPTNWVALYSRGMNYLYWPRSRSRAAEAIRDFKACLELQGRDEVESQPYYLLPYVMLGDAHVKNDDPQSARDVWRKGLLAFPGDPVLIERLSLDDAALAEWVDQERGDGRRVPTDLSYLVGASR